MDGRRASVVIASLNTGAVLQRCLQSIWAQTHPDVEVILVDGGSQDETLEIIGANADRLAHWESGADRGVYHAWNKGLAVASGEWVCFLGADDCFPNPDCLSRLVATAVREDADLVSGRAIVVNSRGRELRAIGEPWSWKRMKRHQCVVHPAMLHRRSLFDAHGLFDDSYRIAGDYEFLLRIGNRVRAAFIDEVVVHLSDGGLSKARLLPVLRETWRVQARHPEIGSLLASVNFVDAILKGQVRRLMGTTP